MRMHRDASTKGILPARKNRFLRSSVRVLFFISPTPFFEAQISEKMACSCSFYAPVSMLPHDVAACLASWVDKSLCFRDMFHVDGRVSAVH